MAPDAPPSVFRPGGITYLHIPCRTPARAADFYEAVFGWTPRRDGEEPAFADGTGHVIGHFVHGEPAAGDTGPRPFIYVDDLEQTLAQVEAHGGAVASEQRPEGTLRVASFRDTEGNVLGVWTETRRPPR